MRAGDKGESAGSAAVRVPNTVANSARPVRR